MKEKRFEELKAGIEKVNAALKDQKEGADFQTLYEQMQNASIMYNKELRLEKYKLLSQADMPMQMFLLDYTCESAVLKPVKDEIKKTTSSYKLETGVQELFLDEFDDYVHATANPAWRAQLKFFAREMGVYKLKRFARGNTTESTIASQVRSAFSSENETKADSKTKLMEELNKLATMVMPGLELKDSELAMMEMIASAKFSGKDGKKEVIKVLSIEKQCDLLKYALAHAYEGHAYDFDLSGSKRKLRKAKEDE